MQTSYWDQFAYQYAVDGNVIVTMNQKMGARLDAGAWFLHLLGVIKEVEHNSVILTLTELASAFNTIPIFFFFNLTLTKELCIMKPNEIRRHAEVIQKDDTNFCLHSKHLSEDQCKEIKKGYKLPKDGSISGGLNIELVHRKEQSPHEIIDDVNGVLSSDTSPRFVGCESLKAPPAPKEPLVRHSRARRYLEEYTIVGETEDQVDVTGVDFKDADIVPGGKTTICI